MIIMIEEIAERLRVGYSIVALFTRLGGLFVVGALLQIAGELEHRGRRGRRSESG
jgi:hypothetical protein